MLFSKDKDVIKEGLKLRGGCSEMFERYFMYTF